VSADRVRNVLGESDLSNTEISERIDVATRYYVDAADGEEVSSDQAEDVVTRLAAHFIATGPERQVDSASESGGSITYAGETGEGLRASTHGQVALALDPTGQLADEDDGGDDVIFSG